VAGSGWYLFLGLETVEARWTKCALGTELLGDGAVGRGEKTCVHSGKRSRPAGSLQAHCRLKVPSPVMERRVGERLHSKLW